MSLHHFMRDDLVGSAIAVILFTAFLFVPGYVIGWLTNVRDFRREPGVWRVLWSLALSVGVMPVVGFLAGSYLGMGMLWGIYAALTGTAAILIARAKPPLGRWPRWLLAACAGWMVVAVLSGVDVQWGSRLYPSVLIYDYNVRAALIDGISRQGLPAINPLFYPGHFVPLRYHYFWFIPCSMVSQMSGGLIGPRQALIASDVWCGWALIAIVLLCLRYFHEGSDALGKSGKWACLLLAAAGLDVIPNALAALVRWTTGSGVIYASAEWWNNPVTGYPHAVLWVAHHVAAVIACLGGFLLLWKRPRTERWPVWLAGVCFASSVGLSIYVAFAFAVTMAAWLAWSALERRWFTVRDGLLAGAVASALAAPYLFAMSRIPGTTGPFVQLTVRSFWIPEQILRGFRWSWTAIAAANLALLPLNYFLEAALLVVVIWLVVRRGLRTGVRTDSARAEIVLVTVPLLIATFLRSGVIENNDLGWRAPLIAQVAAVATGTNILRALVERARRNTRLAHLRGFVLALLVLGVASSGWDLMVMRTYPMLVDAGWAQEAFWLRGRDIGARTFAMRELYEDLQRRIPRNAVVQANPNVWNQVYLGAYAQRQTASFDFECGAVMGGDPTLCAKMQPALLQGFNDPRGPHDVEAMCGTGGIDVLILEKSDSAARDGRPLESTIASSEYARAVMCRVQPLVAHRRYR